MLRCERNSRKTEQLVRSAAAQKFGRGKAVPVFEHGQWWVLVDVYCCGQEVDTHTYSVVDAEPGIGETGLDFEFVG